MQFTFPVKEIRVVSATLNLFGGFIRGMLVEPFSQVVADEALVVRLKVMEDSGAVRPHWSTYSLT